ncbi:hypothetical protein INT43_001396 [Umbelopsis isabellina]|uniref:EF-hand domain-containing protein n=1 Tax=Mortierella isabellina TaxID=91625 RepID=A0A8H7U7P9_MORIS|nr:hypothetical protein INT43_001396 [Umbelopsis isabellina]
MAPVARKSKKRSPRQNSNVFAMFDQQQIIEFKEAFSIMDADHDGFVCAEDLEEVFQQLGQPATPQQIQKMLSETPGAINFTVFLTLMGEKLSGTDPESEILQAFAAFDDDGKGYINAEDLREFMTTMGDRFTDEEVDVMFKGSPVDDHGNFNYREFVRVLKHGE